MAHRFRWLDIDTVCLVAVAIGLCWTLSSPVFAADKPNVLFIAVDDLNDWIGVLGGHPQARTPHIDRLAQRGTLFERCYCAAPACNPSRAALMTGIRPATSGVYKNSNPWRGALPAAVTLPQHLMASGYTALGAGKIYHGSFPDPPSWDDYFPSLERQRPEDPLPEGRPLNGIPNTAHFDWGPLEVDDQQMGDSRVADWVIGQLENSHEKPFFLACGIFRPHLPWYVPRHYFDDFPLDSVLLPETTPSDLEDVPAAGRRMARPGADHTKVVRYKQWTRGVQAYLASIAFADAQIGRVIEALDRSSYADNTIVVLWTDHGWHLGEKEHWRKFALWEDATRTPLIVVVPEVASGQRCSQPVNLLDIYPTLVELCGLPKRPELEGTSLVPLLQDPTGAWERPSLTTHGRNNHALRSRRYRYIRYADGSEELYDHEDDPHEWRNLAADSRYDRVKNELAAFLPDVNVPEFGRAR